MASPFVTRTARGLLATYNGETLGVFLVDEDGADAAAPSMHFMNEATGDELTAGTYARGTVDVLYTIDGETGTLDLDPVGTPYETDTTGETPAGVWFYDTTGADESEWALVVFLPVEAGPGFDEWDVVGPPDGLARVRHVDDDLIAELTAALVTELSTAILDEISEIDGDPA